MEYQSINPCEHSLSKRKDMKKNQVLLRLLIFSTLFAFSLKTTVAQTVLINPSGDGGFENGSTFADNGWTVANNAGGNQWVTGTVPSGFNNRSAYISNDGGVSHSYTNNAASVVHFYRDITFPAFETQVTLSFNWIGNGEPYFSDALMVSLAPTSYVPTASTSSLGLSPLPGTTLIGSFYNQTNVQTANVTIPLSAIGNCSAPQTWRLIFTWKNDISSGTNPPTAIDNISLVSSAPNTSGTYTIDNTQPTIGTNFNSFTDAINWLNNNCVAHSIVFNVIAGQVFNELPPIITATGTSVNTITFQRFGSGANPKILATSGSGVYNTPTADAIICIDGGDYFRFNGIDLEDDPNNNTNVTKMEYGYWLRNAFRTGIGVTGAQNNIIENCRINLQRQSNCYSILTFCHGDATSTGIYFLAPFSASSFSGSNSNNIIRNVFIEDVYRGIELAGSSSFPDENNVITTSQCGAFNIIGNPDVPNDIGMGTDEAYGIRFVNQRDFTISNTRITNVTTREVYAYSTQGHANGIIIDNFYGTCNINNNVISKIRNNGCCTVSGVNGIKASHPASGTHTLRIFFNTISELTSGFEQGPTHQRIFKGIFINGVGGSASQSYEIYNNTICLDGGTALSFSSVCLEVATTTGPVYRVVNNIFANITPAQTTSARHYIYASPSATSFGNTGTFLNHNNHFILYDQGVTGFIGLGGTTEYATLNDWQTAFSQDGSSLSVNPGFINAITDLHATNLALNGIGEPNPPAYLIENLDCNSAPFDDPGAFSIIPCSGTPSGFSITGVNAVCEGPGTTLTLTGPFAQAGFSYQWAVSNTSGGPYTNLGTDFEQTTGPLTTDQYYIVHVTCSSSGLSSVTPEKYLEVKPLPNLAVTPTTAIFCSGSSPVELSATGADTYSWAPNYQLSSTTNSTVYADPQGTVAYYVTGTGLNGCSTSASVVVSYGFTPTVNSISIDPTATLCPGGNYQLNVTGQENTPDLVRYYTFEELTSSYNELTGATVSTIAGDDDRQTNIPLPFSFHYGGMSYTEIGLSSNGVLCLGSNVNFDPFGENNIPSIHVFNGNLIAPLWDDLYAPAGSVSYKTVGAAPNRIFIAEWKGVLWSGNGNPSAPPVNFQVWLYETTNVVEMRYGNMQNGLNPLVSIGLTGSDPTNDWISMSPGNPAVANSVYPNNIISSADYLFAGLVYRFTPPGNTINRYSWAPAGNLTDPFISNPVAENLTASTTFTGTVISAQGCPASANVTANMHPSINATIGATDATCAGNDGSVDVTIAGPGVPVSYQWGTGQNTQDISGLNPGIYAVLITDLNDCAILLKDTVYGSGDFSFYTDTDGDGVGAGSLISGICADDAYSPPVGYALTNTDCAPSDNTKWQLLSGYTDADGDGYTVGALAQICSGASLPVGYTASSLGSDCNDNDAAINPGAIEICDSLDNNCNGQIDENASGEIQYVMVTPVQPVCAAPTQGGLIIDLTGGLDGNTTGLEYAIVGGSVFSGSPNFADVTADPFNIISGFGTTGNPDGDTYTVRVRLKCNTGIFSDQTYTITQASCGATSFSGNIVWERNGVTGVGNANVSLTGPATGNDLTDVNGDFLIQIPATSGNFTLKPTKNTNKLNGVTVADAAAIQQHVTNIAPLPGPYLRIAADVNKSNSISTLDAALISQALLGNSAALNQITSWRFVPSAYTFPNPSIPWGFPEQITLNNVSGNVTGQDFLGIKLGDVTAAWANPANFGQGGPLVLRLNDQTLEAGAELEVQLRADQLDGLAAFQFALWFDPAQLQLSAATPDDAFPLTEGHIGLYRVAEGEIRIVWAQAEDLPLHENTPLFRLRFKALQNGARLSEVLRLYPEALPGYCYNSALAESGVRLEFDGVITNTDHAEVRALQLATQPNPATEQVWVRFNLEQATEATLSILDPGGRLLYEQPFAAAAGENRLPVQVGQLPGGLYLVQLRAGARWGMEKLVVLER
ncbi:MAG: MopE-related protein [Saprospiraceae bacterium]|nr:MopE-related protein [Saprospiraceae bacterium]